MLFRRFYDDGLAQASYMVGCQAIGEAIVIDPHMDIGVYLETAAKEGMRITHITETHIHADFASGSQTLLRALLASQASQPQATLHLSAEGGKDWQYGFASEKDVNLLRNGDRITIGKVMLDVIHTPGHTPEHLTFLVADTARSTAPAGALTGDFIFVGDVGRPDLLERAAGQAGTMQASASQLFHSIQRFKVYPDHLQIWPGHGAGSACGKAMSAAAQSTLGYERIANWALAPMEEAEFTERVLAGQPTAPPYFGAMKARNRDGIPASSGQSRLPRKLTVSELQEAATQQGEGSPFILDVRNRDEWAKGHIDGATLIPLPELHARLDELPKDRPIIVHCQRGGRSAAASATLDAFGFTDVHDVAGGFAAWEEANLPVMADQV